MIANACDVVGESGIGTLQQAASCDIVGVGLIMDGGGGGLAGTGRHTGPEVVFAEVGWRTD